MLSSGLADVQQAALEVTQGAVGKTLAPTQNDGAHSETCPGDVEGTLDTESSGSRTNHSKTGQSWVVTAPV